MNSVISMNSVIRRLCLSARSLLAASTSSAINVEDFGQLATGTGRGPFIELPKFSPIGSPGSLLKMQIPASSTVNIRSGSMIALNGNLDSLSLRQKTDSDFQLLEAMAPATMVMSGNHDEAYRVLDVSNDRKWTVLRARDITAWCGYDMELQRCSLTPTIEAYRTSGRGTMVVSGGSSLYEVNLSPREEMDVIPEHLIAFQGGNAIPLKTSGAVSNKWIPLKYIRVPEVVRITVRDWKNALGQQWHHLMTASGLERQLQIVSSPFRSAARYMVPYIKRVWAKQAYFQVVGPARLLISGTR